MESRIKKSESEREDGSQVIQHIPLHLLNIGIHPCQSCCEVHQNEDLAAYLLSLYPYDFIKLALELNWVFFLQQHPIAVLS